MDIIFPQIIVALVILILFFVTFKQDKTKITTKEMVVIALLCVLTAVLSKALSIKIPPAQPIFVISFAVAISITIGLLFSPKLALIAGVIIDIIGLLIAYSVGEASMPFLGFTLTAILACYLPSILIRTTKNFKPITLNMMIIGILVLSVVISGLFLFSTDVISIDRMQNDLTDSLRYTIMGILILISVVISIINFVMNKKINQANGLYVTTAHLTLIVLVVEIIAHIILTSLWINIMYGVPFMIAAATRILRSILMLPINVTIIYLILKYIPAQYKKHLIKEDPANS